MFNTNNKNLISFSFGILAVITLTIFTTPTKASANCTYYVEHGSEFANCTYDSMNPGASAAVNNINTYQNTYNTINPVPSISSVTPNGTQLNSNTMITVYGYGFVQGSVVRWNGADRTTSYIDSSTLRAQLNYSDLSYGGNYLITVSNPAPGGGLSNAVSFTVNNNVASTTIKNSNTTSKTNTATTTKNTTSNNTTTNQGTTAVNQASDQAAGALFGSNAFLPSSLLQWFFFIILILLAVVLWRKLYVNDEERSNTHLKHA